MNIKCQSLMRLLIFFLLLVSVHCRILSQEAGSCAEKLKTAQTLFDRGQVEQVPFILQECMKSGFTSEESLYAYKLLIQSYLFEERLAKADSTMLEFLKKNPEYELSPTDHSSFVYLFSNFQVKPLVQISFHFGTNIPFLTFIGREDVPGEKGASDYSSDLINLYTSLEAKFKLNEKLEINFEPGYSQLAFTSVKEFIQVGNTTYKESLKRLEIPVTLTYNLKSFGRLTAYGRMGAGPALSLGSVATADFKPADINGTPHTGSDINREASRISLDMFAQGGAGAKFKTPGGYIFAELRANFGLFNQVISAGTSPEEQELGLFYYYADDDFHINAVNFTVGYTQIFYKPLKRK